MTCSRFDVVNLALDVVDLGANPRNPEVRQQYLDLIAPGETKQLVEAMAKMSGCALVVAGIWRRAGLQNTQLEPPYKIGSAIARLISVARQLNSWRLYQKGLMPKPGDMVLVGDNRGGGVEHVYTVTSVDSEKKTLESVDGGQKDSAGYQTILRRRRTWANGRDVVFQGSDPGSRSVGGRVIVGVVDVGKLLKLEDG